MKSKDSVYVTRLKLVNDYPILKGTINDPKSAIELMADYIKDSPTEMLLVGNLDTKGNLIDIAVAAKGDVDRAIVPVRTISQHAVLANATSCIMMHNHPSGDIQESRDDVQISNLVGKALSMFNIQLFDSIVVSSITQSANEHSYNSLAEKGLLNYSSSISMRDEGNIYVINRSNAKEFMEKKTIEEEMEF